MWAGNAATAIARVVSGLSFQRHRDAGDLAAQRGGEFGYRATHVPHCGKARVQRFDDIRRHALDRALRDGLVTVE